MLFNSVFSRTSWNRIDCGRFLWGFTWRIFCWLHFLTRLYTRISFILSRLISQLKLLCLMRSSVLESSHVIIVFVKKVKIFIDTFPWLMKIRCFIFFYVVIVIGFFNLISFFFFDKFVSFVIEHSFFCNSFDSVAIFVSLLFLWDCVSIFMLSCRILEVTLGIDFPIRSNCGTTHKCLTDIRSLLLVLMSLLMH